MRTKSSLLIGVYCDQNGIYWENLRASVECVGRALKIDQKGKTRSVVAIEIGHALESRGLTVPDGYVPPWTRPAYVRGMPSIQRVTSA